MRADVRGGASAAVLVLLMALCAAPAAQEPASPALPGEWISSRPAAEVFAAARATVLALGFHLERDDAPTGILVTRRRRYDPAWPDAPVLELTTTQTPEFATLHIRVPPGLHPARVVVGAVLETATVFVPYRLPIARGHQTFYRHLPLAAFAAGRIAERLGQVFEPLSSDPEERARQTARHAGAVRPSCGAAALVAGKTPDAFPRLLHEVKPQYPSTELERRLGGTVVLRGEVTEHGTLTGLDWLSGVEDANLVAAAIGAAGLWRFTPPMAGACPARRAIVVEMSFTLGR